MGSSLSGKTAGTGPADVGSKPTFPPYYFGSEAADQGRALVYCNSLAGERVSVRSRLFSVVLTRDYKQVKQKSTDVFGVEWELATPTFIHRVSSDPPGAQGLQRSNHLKVLPYLNRAGKLTS